MSDILPIFCPHYNFAFGSTLSLEEAGKTSPGNPASICDIARANHLSQVVIVDDKLDGFIEAFKNLSKPFKASPPKALEDYVRDAQKDRKEPSDTDRAKGQRLLDEAIIKYSTEKAWMTTPIQLIFGVKLIVCADEADKSDESLKTESNIIIFIRNTQGYSDLIRLYNRAWTTNCHHQGRTSWRQMKEFWTDNLVLVLPFFSSCIQRNALTMSNIVPDFPTRPLLFKEIDSGLPFAPIIERGVDQFAAAHDLDVQPIKTIYYEDGARDFDAYVNFRAMGNRGQYQRPGVDHMCSDRFSYTECRRLAQAS